MPVASGSWAPSSGQQCPNTVGPISILLGDLPPDRDSLKDRAESSERPHCLAPAWRRHFLPCPGLSRLDPVGGSPALLSDLSWAPLLGLLPCHSSSGLYQKISLLSLEGHSPSPGSSHPECNSALPGVLDIVPDHSSIGSSFRALE